MHTDDVRTFLAVVDEGSISAAARELHLTQPAVTRRVQRVEQAAGSSLIDRRSRPFVLTESGRAAIEHCRRLVSAADELKIVAQDGLTPCRELRIGVAHALTEIALVEPLDHTRRCFPQAMLRLFAGWSRDLLGRVKTTGLDAAVILLPAREGAPGGVEAHRLAREKLEIVAPRSWRTRRRRTRELGNVEWILSPEGCAARAELRKALGRTGLPFRVSVETYNYELQLRLIAAGRGLGLVPMRLLARSPLRANLCVLALRELTFPLTIWMVTGELSPGLDAPIGLFRQALVGRLAAADA